jgi:uncharacterized membrane protein YphA (DoxX/SURF4 family)
MEVTAMGSEKVEGAQPQSRPRLALGSAPLASRLAPVTPLLVRIVVGAVMIAHAGHFAPAEFGVILNQRLGLPFSELLAWASTLMLYIGGGMFVLGLASRLVAIPFMLQMTFATLLIDIHEGLAPTSGGGMQIPLLLLVSSLVIYVCGPGPLSLDSVFRLDRGWARSFAQPKTPSA